MDDSEPGVLQLAVAAGEPLSEITLLFDRSTVGVQTHDMVLVNQALLADRYGRTVSSEEMYLQVNEAPVPDGPQLRNHPNPFNPSTTVAFSLPETEAVRIDVYDIRGALVRQLVTDTLGPGEHTAVWDGRDDDGAPVASGVFLIRMRAGHHDLHHQTLMIK